jgi:S1-C subfamily serine protease
VITQVDGIAVDTMDELISLLRRHSAGDQVTLRVERDGATDSRPVTLGAL